MRELQSGVQMHLRGEQLLQRRREERRRQQQEEEETTESKIDKIKEESTSTLLCRKVTARPVTFEDTMRIGRIFPISHIIIRIFVGTVLQ